MRRTVSYLRGVEGLVDLARMQDHRIGAYREHFANDERGTMRIVLDNGQMVVSLALIKALEEDRASVTKDLIVQAARSFQAWGYC
jgi:hypothetical protein